MKLKKGVYCPICGWHLVIKDDKGFYNCVCGIVINFVEIDKKTGFIGVIQKEIPLEPLPDYGDHITIKKFKSWFNSGSISDYDGVGYYATKDKMSRIPIDLTHILFDGKLRKDFKYVVWFNK